MVQEGLVLLDGFSKLRLAVRNTIAGLLLGGRTISLGAAVDALVAVTQAPAAFRPLSVALSESAVNTLYCVRGDIAVAGDSS